MDYKFEQIDWMLILYTYEDLFSKYDWELHKKWRHQLHRNKLGWLMIWNCIRDYWEDFDYSWTYCKYEEIEYQVIMEARNRKLREWTLYYMCNNDTPTDKEPS